MKIFWLIVGGVLAIVASALALFQWLGAIKSVGLDKELETHPETIKCPECGLVQEAIVEHTFPWPTFIHHCSGCKHIIMESEWQRVNEQIQYS